jgi:tetratricopeptide (TPR) repeat protein
VRRGNDRVRVTAQLIRAADDTHLWSETFDGSDEDAISIQETIALSIARALQTTMDPAELKRMIAAGTNSVAAWELYLRALALQNDARAVDETKSADEQLAYLERAVALDPTFVDAHIGIAGLWAGHRSSTLMTKISTDISDAEAKQRFDRAIEAAAANARSESSRLEYQALQATEDVRLRDALALNESLVELRPNDSDAVFQLLYLQLMTGAYDAARATGIRLGGLLRAAGLGESNAYQMLHRLDVPAALEMVEYELTPSRQRFADLYQAHRVLLYAGKTARAAEVAAQFATLNPSPDSLLMVQIRQACAEGRVADADALYAGAPPLQNRWLYLKTLGRDADALALLQEYDNPAGAHTLSDYLAYTTFDPGDYPYLAGVLAEQGIKRPPAHTIPFACRR